MIGKVAVVGVFYDGYMDLWEDFIILFERFWPDCPYEKYIVNQVAECEFGHSFKIIHAGNDAEYSKKIQTAIDSIGADYYLLLLDDFFIGKAVDSNKIREILEFMQTNDMKYCSMPLPEFKRSFKGKKINNQFRRISSKAEYTVSCQAAIWEKNFLKECVGNANYNAWVFEGVYSKSIKAHSSAFLSKCCANISNPLNLKHGALQGKIVPTTRKYFQTIGYEMHNNRETLSRRIYFSHQIKSFIKSLVPFAIQSKIKKRFNTKSVIEKYSEEIKRVMQSLGLE